MRYPLYGQDITDETLPYEVGLGWVVKPDKGDFIGRSEMLARKEQGLQKKLVGVELLGPGIPRAGYKVFSIDSEEIGVVTSGTLSPSLNKAIGVCFIDRAASEVGKKLFVELRSKKVEAEIVKTPFYRKK